MARLRNGADVSNGGVSESERRPLMKFLWKKKDEKPVEEEEDKPKEEPVQKVPLRQLIRYATRLDIALMLLGGALAVITGLGMPMLSIIMGDISQSFITAAQNLSSATTFQEITDAIDAFQSAVIASCIRYAIVGGFIFFSASIQVSCYLTACERMTDALRRHFVRAVLRQDIAWFDKSHSGTLAAKLFDNLERVREGTGDKVALLISYTAQFFGGFIVAFSYSWQLTLIMMSLSPFMILCGAFIAKLMATLTAEEAKNYAVAGGIAEEVLTSIRTVHAFNAQPFEIKRYEKELVKGKKEGIKKSVYVGVGLGVTFLIVFTSYCLAFWVGTDYIADGKYEAGTVMTVFFSVMMGSMALGLAGPQFAVIGSAQGAASPLHEIIDRKPEIDAYSTDGLRPSKTDGYVEFKDVRFAYPNRAEVEILKGISLSCKPGQTIAFVGSSGCGKSTTISLLLRYYDPTSGQILLDGKPLKEYNVKFLRERIGVVSQEPILFDTSIEENIQFGRADVTREDIHEALKKANAYDFVAELPDGVKTLVGTRGTQLSGGQKQRIAIARALVRNPSILLLDEATSALDAHSESVVQKALENATIGRTTFIIAHRLSTIRNADAILVFKDGVVVESGKHEELLHLKGHYHALVHSQVFMDIEEAEKDCDPVSGRRTSRTQSKAADMIEKEKEEEKKDGSKEKNELKRLKKELAEEGVARVGMLGILSAARPEWPYILIAFVASAVQGCVFPAFSLFFTDIISVFSNTNVEEMRKEGHMYALLFLALGIVNAVTMLIACFFFGLVSEQLTMRLRMQTFTQMLSMDIAYMDDPKHAPGKMCTRLASDAPMVKSALDYRLGQVVSSIISVCAGVVIAFIYGWQMALLMVAIFPLRAIGSAVQMRYMRNRSTNDNANLETAGKIATEAMENVRTVQALTLEDNVYERFCEQLDEPLRTATWNAVIQGISFGFSSSIFYFLYAASFRFGVWLVARGDMPVMYVLKCLYAISFTAGTLGLATAYFPEYTKATFAAGLIFKMLGVKTRIDAITEEEGEKSKLIGHVHFEDVHFEYEQRRGVTVLKGLSLDVQPGHTVALVGPSGCGKSTVVSLLERFYDPTNGKVMIDGKAVQARNLRNVRAQMSIVNQEPILFDMSIGDNIRYGLDEVNDNDIQEAAKMANAHNFITAFPKGYDTRVGEKGIQLSGGQKQRIAIARALIRNPTILLLDEATSALDMESEKIVQEALDSAASGRTCIVIAHRLATVVNANCIVVVNEGRIVEQGTHSELMEARGAYFRLQTKQSKVSEK